MAVYINAMLITRAISQNIRNVIGKRLISHSFFSLFELFFSNNSNNFPMIFFLIYHSALLKFGNDNGQITFKIRSDAR